MKRKTIYEGKILNLEVLDDKWEVVTHDEAVSILAVQDDKILGVEQYRPAIEKTTWELPAGLIDKGETPLEAAARELAEETQLKGTLKLITQFYSSPGFTTEKLYLFEASQLSAGYGTPDEDEDLKLSWRDPVDLWQAIKSGEVACSAPTVLGLSILLNRLEN